MCRFVSGKGRIFDSRSYGPTESLHIFLLCLHLLGPWECVSRRNGRRAVPTVVCGSSEIVGKQVLNAGAPGAAPPPAHVNHRESRYRSHLATHFGLKTELDSQATPLHREFVLVEIGETLLVF